MPIAVAVLVGEELGALAHRRAALGKQADAAAGGAVGDLARIDASPGKPPARAPPARRAGWIAHSSAASTGVVVRSMSWP